MVKEEKFVFLHSQKTIARSSNGRTSDFGSDYVGSNPARATNKPLRPEAEGVLCLYNEPKAKLSGEEYKHKTVHVERELVCLSINSTMDQRASGGCERLRTQFIG